VTLLPLVLFVAAVIQTIRVDQTPLHKGCGDNAVLATLASREKVTVKFSLAGTGQPCVLVSVTVNGAQVDGYVAPDSLTGIEEMEAERRAAPPITAGISSIAPAAKPAAKAAPFRSPEPAPEAGYERELGRQVADFGFVDLEGRPRHLSEFNGRYVLLDFWGAWCGPCRRETPFLKQAYARYRPQGLEIIGLNTDSDENVLREYMRAQGVDWTQAKLESIKDVVYGRFRVRQFPTTLLLDRQRRIVATEGLRGSQLLKTLDSFLNR
jgi:thiol-disulfide isomerase/thioredoxin